MRGRGTWGLSGMMALWLGALPAAALAAEPVPASGLATRVKDIRPGAGDGLPGDYKPYFSLYALGSTLVLRADDGMSGPALWRSDGTGAGTRLVKDFSPDGLDGLGDEATLLDGTLYFHALSEGGGLGLWRLEASSVDAPALVRELDSGSGATSYLRAFGRRLTFFHTTDGVGREPWESDGTAAGTRLLADVNAGGADSDPSLFRGWGNKVFFTANDGVHGQELWCSDAPGQGPRLVRDIHPTGSGIAFMASDSLVLGDTLYFTADDGVHGRELWRSDGTSEGTRLVKDLVEGPTDGIDGWLSSVGDTLFFVARPPAAPAQLWRSKGTAETTLRVPGVAPEGPSVEIDGALLFPGRGPGGELALWRTDGTEQGTVLLKALTRISSDAYDGYKVVDGLLVFRADDGVHGLEPWRSDGTPEGTFMLDDVRPGAEGSDASYFTLAGGTLYFRATDGVSGYELWSMPMSKVHDPFVPTVSCPASLEVMAPTAAGVAVTYPAAQVSDNALVPPAVSYSSPSGSTFPVGVTQVVVTAKDAAQNAASCSFQVTVRQAEQLIDGPPDFTPISAPDKGCAAAGGHAAAWLAVLGALAWMRRRRTGATRALTR